MKGSFLTIVFTVTVLALASFSLATYTSEDSDAIDYYNTVIGITFTEGKYGSSYNAAIGRTTGTHVNAYVVAGSGSLPSGITIRLDNSPTASYNIYIEGTADTPGLYFFVLCRQKLADGTNAIVSEDLARVVIDVMEKVTYHNANGTTTDEWYPSYYSHFAPSGTATPGNVFCGWNTESDGTGITYLQNSTVPFGIKHFYAQQSPTPAYIQFYSSFAPGSVYLNLGVIPGQDVMIPTYNVMGVPIETTGPTAIKAEIGYNTQQNGSGILYLNSQPVQFSSSLTLYGQKAIIDPSRTVVITGSAAYYVPRGEVFNYSFSKGVPLRFYHSSGQIGHISPDMSYLAPCVVGTQDVFNEGYTMTADADVYIITKTPGGYNISPIVVEYDSNGGTGSMKKDATGIESVSQKFHNTLASACTFIPPAGKIFKQWHVGSITGPTVSPGGIIYGTGGLIKLYAEWMDIPPDPIYVISYNSNGGLGSIEPGTVIQGQIFTITTEEFTPPNQKIMGGWGIAGSSTIFQSGDTFTPTSDITLVAIWNWDYFFINLIPNGAPGAAISSQSPGDSLYTMPPSPFTWEDHIFTGWKLNNEGSNYAVGYNIMPQGNLNLYAQWMDVSDPGPDPAEDKGFKLSTEMIMIFFLIIVIIILLLAVIFRDD